MLTGLHSEHVLGTQARAAFIDNAGGVHNLIVSHGADDFQGLLKKMNRGLMVTQLMGQGINGVIARLLARRRRFLDRERRDSISRGERDHYRRQPLKEHVSGDRGDRQRRRCARGGIRTGSVLLEKMTIAGE